MIRQPLAFDSLNRGFGPVNIAVAQADSVIVAEIKFRKIAVQVLLFAVLINAARAALEDGERPFDGVGVNVAANVFFDAMLHGLMRSEMSVRASVEFAFVRHAALRL